MLLLGMNIYTKNDLMPSKLCYISICIFVMIDQYSLVRNRRTVGCISHALELKALRFLAKLLFIE